MEDQGASNSERPFTDKEFMALFRDNIYLSREFAEIVAKSLKMRLGTAKIGTKTVCTLNTKTAGLHAYTGIECDELEQQGIHYGAVLNQDNNHAKRQSMKEYALLACRPYPAVRKDYRKQFRNQVVQAERNGLKVEALTTNSAGFIRQRNIAFQIYRQAIRKHKSFCMPRELCDAMSAMTGAKVWLCKTDERIISYAIALENRENIYISLQGSDSSAMHLRPSNRIYDTIIARAMDERKNVHCGCGLRGEGYQRFKMSTGFTMLSVREPRHAATLRDLGHSIIKTPRLNDVIGLLANLAAMTPSMRRALIQLYVPFT